MKNWLAILTIVVALPVHAAEKITVAANAVPHAEILDFVKADLAKQGIDLEIKVFTDYVQPNVQVIEKHLDANFFQHQPYLDEFRRSRGSDLVAIAGVHIEPLGAYSSKHKAIADLPDGANVAIANDATNSGRALLLLQKSGLIRLKEGVTITATVRDIIDNPKRIKIRELEAATLPRVLNQVDLVLINTNYALEAKLNPRKDALAIEDKDSPYVNILVVRSENKNRPALQKLVQALHSEAVKKFIAEKYKGAIEPAS